MGKSLIKPNNMLKRLILIMLALAFVISCKKEAPSSDPGLFVKTYPTDSAATGEYLAQMSDGGFIIISNYGSGAPLITRTDKYGNLKWNRIIPRYGNPY